MLQHVKSSMITIVDYHQENQILKVTFHSGETYAYFNVPFNIYQELLNADSKGRFMNNNIIEMYDYARIYDENTKF